MKSPEMNGLMFWKTIVYRQQQLNQWYDDRVNYWSGDGVNYWSGDRMIYWLGERVNF